jgi:hypothetical protein
MIVALKAGDDSKHSEGFSAGQRAAKNRTDNDRGGRQVTTELLALSIPIAD